MGKYNIEFKKSALKELKQIFTDDGKKIMQKISLLAEDPFPKGVKKIAGFRLYRLRVGDYRVLYEVIGERLIIYIIRIRHRKDVYK